jgi:hypothetical protein
MSPEYFSVPETIAPQKINLRAAVHYNKANTFSPPKSLQWKN